MHENEIYLGARVDRCALIKILSFFCTISFSIAESYQEGSINHPSHTMYPMCHQCPRNSSYQDCVNKRTLKRCNNGLDNICYTKSFQSKTRGLIYEMGCSNHKMCQKAKAKPCKGEMDVRKCCFLVTKFSSINIIF